MGLLVGGLNSKSAGAALAQGTHDVSKKKDNTKHLMLLQYEPQTLWPVAVVDAW
jgi:hypothetical protein